VFTRSYRPIAQVSDNPFSKASFVLDPDWLHARLYRLTMQPNCAKYGWHAEGNGTSFDFCTATKGGAGITQTPPPEGPTEIDCNQTNRPK
jgi:hypothetical protein